MSGETTGSDILDQYRNISNKLKKRFLRKPNVTEACESFTRLGQQCESLEMPSYAGLCWIAAARCEGSLGNAPGETSALIRSARQFSVAEETDFNLGCPSASAENLEASLSCYSHACSRLTDNSIIPIGLNLEIVEFLKKIDRTEYIDSYIRNALQLCDDKPETKIHCLELLATNFIDSGNYTSALETFMEIVSILSSLTMNGARADILLKCEISCVFLVLILRPTPQRLSPNLAKLLEKYTWGDKNDKSLLACRMSEKMFLLLQSLVMMCQSADTSGVTKLEGEFWPLLSKEHKELVRTLVQIYHP